MWFKSIPRRTSVGLSPVSYTFAGVILFVCLFVVVVVVVSHVVQVHPEKDLSRVVPSKLYVYGCCFCLFVVVVVVSHVVQFHPEKDLSRVVPSKLYVCRCYFVCLFVCGCFVV